MAIIIINQNMPKCRIENCTLKPFNITLESPSTLPIQGQKCFNTSTNDAYRYDENKGWEKYE